jgi:hypothetical protein
MNHRKIYDNIIEKAKSKNRIRLSKNNSNYVYYENHHIVPKCLGGTDEKENKVLLTAREHYICHKLLTYIYINNYKIISAFHRMTFDRKNRKVSLRDYEYAKLIKNNTPLPIETIEKMRIMKLNFIPWNKNLKNCFSEISRKKMSDSRKGIKHSEERNNRKSQRMKGIKKSEDAKQNMREAQRNKKLSEEHKQHLREANLGKISPKKGIKISKEIIEKIKYTLKNKPKLICPVCKKIIDSNNYKKYKHGDNCKQKSIL